MDFPRRVDRENIDKILELVRDYLTKNLYLVIDGFTFIEKGKGKGHPLMRYWRGLIDLNQKIIKGSVYGEDEHYFAIRLITLVGYAKLVGDVKGIKKLRLDCQSRGSFTAHCQS